MMRMPNHNDMKACNAMSPFALRVHGMASVGEYAAEVKKLKAA